jgi:hypothetical protein
MEACHHTLSFLQLSFRDGESKAQGIVDLTKLKSSFGGPNLEIYMLLTPSSWCCLSNC